ncbi:hypothetical protein B0J12DRAFT_661576 [Macrophomina phaseolina]|uniref:Uncharacterized protein n=1 Tax=Macrophomina phaseolina TaxID=35725 RepID=A0ABQ8GDL0_9PEZI|nr:hypothetical protein B0J12DRAFT_661576 [Macrophomina phaseolina]
MMLVTRQRMVQARSRLEQPSVRKAGFLQHSINLLTYCSGPSELCFAEDVAIAGGGDGACAHSRCAFCCATALCWMAVQRGFVSSICEAARSIVLWLWTRERADTVAWERKHHQLWPAHRWGFVSVRDAPTSKEQGERVEGAQAWLASTAREVGLYKARQSGSQQRCGVANADCMQARWSLRAGGQNGRAQARILSRQLGAQCEAVTGHEESCLAMAVALVLAWTGSARAPRHAHGVQAEA